MAHLVKPFFNYGMVGLYPDVDEDELGDIDGVERHDHIAASGKRQSYLVGTRGFRDVTFRWQTDALKTKWETMWAVIRDGRRFEYYDDDSIPKYGGSGLTYGSTLIVGSTSDSDAVVQTNMVIENTELSYEREDVDGFWSISVQMREAV